MYKKLIRLVRKNFSTATDFRDQIKFSKTVLNNCSFQISIIFMLQVWNKIEVKEKLFLPRLCWSNVDIAVTSLYFLLHLGNRFSCVE